MPVIAVLGARNLGRAILDHFRAGGWDGAAIARSQASLEGIDGLGIQADASDPEALRAALARVRSELGGLDLVVNAVSAARRTGGAFGGGALGEATLDDFRGWGVAVAEQAFVFLSEGARALRAAGGGGTLVQVTGGSAGSTSSSTPSAPRARRAPAARSAAGRSPRRRSRTSAAGAPRWPSRPSSSSPRAARRSARPAAGRSSR